MRFTDIAVRTAYNFGVADFIVYRSMQGLHLVDGPGPARANFHNEKEFNSIQGTNVLHLRPGLFYSNFYGAADMIRQQILLEIILVETLFWLFLIPMILRK